MTKQTEAMKLALEALEDTLSDDPYPYSLESKAITALREALAEQPAQTDWEAVAADQAMTIALLKADQPAQQEPVAWYRDEDGIRIYYESKVWDDATPLYTSPPAQRNPLTHEQRVDLLAKFEAHKHEWHAPAILIDMVEAAHGIKGDA